MLCFRNDWAPWIEQSNSAARKPTLKQMGAERGPGISEYEEEGLIRFARRQLKADRALLGRSSNEIVRGLQVASVPSINARLIWRENGIPLETQK